LIDSIAASHGIHSTLVRAVIEVESAYDRYAISSKDARGLMQLIPETGRRYGVRDFFDPRQNIEGGVRYLRFLLDKFDGNVDLTLAAYNSGENRVERLGRIPYIPETVNYVRKVRAAIARMGGLTSPLVTSTSPANATGSEAPIASTTDTLGVRTFSNLNGY
jgi:soluble lytic murein transglycosylase-like protein